MEREELGETVQQDLETRVREVIEALLEQILDEEMTGHLGAPSYRRSPSSRRQRNGDYERALDTGAAILRQLRGPRDRAATFQTELFRASGGDLHS